MVMGGDSCSEGRWFECKLRILDGHFSHFFVVKIVMFVSKDKKNKKEAGNSPFLKTSLAYFTAIKKSIALPFPLAYSSKSHRKY